MTTSAERIEHISKFIESDNLSEAQVDLVISFEEQFQRRGRLSERQLEVLEDIFKQVA